MAFVPMGIAVIAAITLLLIRKRKTEYTLVDEQGETYTCSNNTNGVIRNYGSINGGGQKSGSVSSSNSTGESNNHDSGLVSGLEEADIPPLRAAPDSPPTNTSSLQVSAAVRERQRVSSGGSSSTPRKPSFIVGSTPPEQI